MSDVLKIRPAADVKRGTASSLGEVMLRLDPGDGRVRTRASIRGLGRRRRIQRRARAAQVLRACAPASSPRLPTTVGRLVQDLIYQGGVDQSHVKWVKYDGVGRNSAQRTEFHRDAASAFARALGCSDRGHTAVSQLKPGDIDWEKIFGEEGARWFHTGGIFAALVRNTRRASSNEAMEAAQEARHDHLLRSQLPRHRCGRAIGGQDKAQEVNRDIAKYVDVMIGNEEDFTACLGFEVEGRGRAHLATSTSANFKKMIETAVKEFPNFKVAATTLRNAKTATRQRLGRRPAMPTANSIKSMMRENLEIFDRVGGGDCFASGLVYGFLEGKDPQEAVEYGAAHGALAMTTPGRHVDGQCRGSRSRDEGQRRAGYPLTRSAIDDEESNAIYCWL